MGDREVKEIKGERKTYTWEASWQKGEKVCCAYLGSKEGG
jgi:hypothetical protein